MDWGRTSRPFLRRSTITTEEDCFHSVEVVVLLQVLEDFQEELFDVLVTAGKVVGTLELCSP